MYLSLDHVFQAYYEWTSVLQAQGLFIETKSGGGGSIVLKNWNSFVTVGARLQYFRRTEENAAKHKSNCEKIIEHYLWSSIILDR